MGSKTKEEWTNFVFFFFFFDIVQRAPFACQSKAIIASNDRLIESRKLLLLNVIEKESVLQ